QQNSGTSVGLKSVDFVDVSTGWAVGGGGTILKTIDEGSTWITQNSGVPGVLESVHFVDTKIGWTVGGNVILKTIDGGEIWIPKISGAGGLESVFFIDSNIGWAVGGYMNYSTGVIYSTIIKTTDGGENWVHQSSGTSRILNAVFFIDAKTGWAVGMDGIIIKTTTGGETWVEERTPPHPKISNKLELFQNYPNPFNSSTTIHFNLLKTSFVILKVYNIVGCEIETLECGEKSAGEYIIVWTATNLPSGLYFCRLEAGDIRETKKLLLQK
ncbi:MAG TPA: YCF48-related protein, partial [bacterium]